MEGIGVRAEVQRGKDTVVRVHEDGYTVILRQLVTINICLKGIQSIEIWRVTRKGKEKAMTLDQVTYVITPEPGMTLNRIPILTNMVRTHTANGKTGFKWQGFEWGRLPLLTDKLKTDQGLNSRLLGLIDEDVIDTLRITASSGEKIGITTSYNPQRLPSREFLACIEDIANHVCDYVAERNSARGKEESKAREYYWATDTLKAGKSRLG